MSAVQMGARGMWGIMVDKGDTPGIFPFCDSQVVRLLADWRSSQNTDRPLAIRTVVEQILVRGNELVADIGEFLKDHNRRTAYNNGVSQNYRPDKYWVVTIPKRINGTMVQYEIGDIRRLPNFSSSSKFR